MNDRMEEWMRLREEQVQRFTPSEIKAEIIRQEIAELESSCLDAASPDFNPETILQGLERLKRRLAMLQQPASLATEGRMHIGKMLDLARRGLATGIIPPESIDVLENCKGWLNTMEEERRKRRKSEMGVFRQTWKAAGWDTRVGMVRWLGRWGSRHVVGSRVRYEVSRLGMKAAIWLSRR